MASAAGGETPVTTPRARLSMVAAALLLAIPALAQEAPRSVTPGAVKLPARVTDVARGLVHPWGLAFLPDGRMLVTERPGRLRIVQPDGTVSAPLAGVPRLAAEGQGGLLDVVVAPDFAQSRTIYLSYSEPGEGGTLGTTAARARLGQAGLEQVQVIFRQEPKVTGGAHFGSRIVFARDGTLFITTGD